MAVLQRKDVTLEQTWNKESVYPAWKDWQADFEAAKSDLPALTAYQDTLGQGPERLAAWFEQYGRQYQRLYRLLSYAGMHLNVDANDAEAKGYYGQAVGLYAQFLAAVAFVEPEILALGEIVFEWAEQHPPLADYRHYFDNILRLKPHKRAIEVEELLGMLEEPFSGVGRTVSELTNTDMKFVEALDSQNQKHPVLQATIPPTGVQSTDRLRRKSAWES